MTHVTEIGANTSLTHPRDSIGKLLRHTVSGVSGDLDYVGIFSVK